MKNESFIIKINEVNFDTLKLAIKSYKLIKDIL